MRPAERGWVIVGIIAAAAAFLFFATGHGAPSPAEDVVSIIRGQGGYVYEDGAYEFPDGRTGCIPGEACEHDGRVADCDRVTEDGVTEHLDAFAERCATDETPCWSPDPAVYCGPAQVAPPG